MGLKTQIALEAELLEFAHRAEAGEFFHKKGLLCLAALGPMKRAEGTRGRVEGETP